MPQVHEDLAGSSNVDTQREQELYLDYPLMHLPIRERSHNRRPSKRFKLNTRVLRENEPCPDSDVAETMKTLIAAGAEVEAKDDRNQTPLTVAVSSRNLPATQVLVKAGANCEHCPEGSQSPLAVALKNDDLPIAKLLVAAGANPVAQLLGAVTDQSLQQVKFLANAGVDLQTELPGGLTLLHLAASTGVEELVSLLLKLGFPVNKTANYLKETPLHFAAEEGHIKVVQQLLTSGANVNAKDVRGWTPLRWAFIEGHNEIVECLRNSGGVL